MFDEKYHDRNDEFALRMERLGNQMNPSPRLMQAAKDGVPLRKWGNQYSAGYHLKKFAQAAMIYAVCIGLFLGLFFLLPDLPQASPPVGGNEGTTELRVPHKVPKGWEAVSTDGSMVTHIRMKEGTDAYHWMKTSINQVGGHFVRTWEIPDHQPAWKQTVTVILYYSCVYMDDGGPYLFTEQYAADKFRPLELYMTGNGLDQLLLQINSPQDLTPVSFRQEEYTTYQVGLTQGVMITIPLSVFEGDGDGVKFNM
ncbi:MAG: hypothetical protein IJ955_05290, partial [Oscillospiraceae bacterium]|nr:hypothetical protein [Oscillospiraceae bacterium]